MLIAAFPSRRISIPWTIVCWDFPMNKQGIGSDSQLLVIQHNRICRSNCSQWIKNFMTVQSRYSLPRNRKENVWSEQELQNMFKLKVIPFPPWGLNFLQLKSYLGVNPVCICWFHWRPYLRFIKHNYSRLTFSFKKDLNYEHERMIIALEVHSTVFNIDRRQCNRRWLMSYFYQSNNCNFIKIIESSENISFIIRSPKKQLSYFFSLSWGAISKCN